VRYLSHDKITVDEPLISTDVDSLIRTLAERRKVALNELRQICRIDKKTLEKWVAVLEDEGYISIEYGLGGTYVIWKGTDEEPEPKYASPLSPPVEPAAPEPDLSDIGVAESDEAEAEPVAEDTHKEAPEDFAVELPLDDSEPEELLNQYLDRKKRTSSSSDSMKSNILTSLEDKEEPKEAAEISSEENPTDESILPFADEDEEKTYQLDSESGNTSGERDGGDESDHASDSDAFGYVSRDSADGESEDRGEASDERDGDDSSGRGKEELVVPRATAADIRDLMGTYVQEINREKAKIEELKKEKDALYRDKFASMDGRMQADMVLLMEKILEKQGKLTELKERVLELPDKVDELSKLQDQMGALKTEGRDALLRTKEKASEYLSHIEEAKADVKDKVAEADEVIKEQNVRLKELEKTQTSLDSRTFKLKVSVQSVKSQVDELNKAMDSLNENLQNVEQMKSEASAAADAIKEIVAARGAELESLEQELEGVARVEHWVQEYIRDYEQKIDSVEQYVSTSDEELAELKEASEALYMKRYLGELEKMADTYDDELQDAVSKEGDIEQKMTESKSRITKLVTESQQMARKLRGDLKDSIDYDSLVAKIKEKTAKAKTTFEEKKDERAKLVDDSRKTRKTKSSGKTKLRSIPKKKKRK
jgi:methyl-accepting chemotaxis protein